jgi:hypothetical protein
MRWKVGAIQATEYGPSRTYGFSFSVQDSHGAPLLTLSYVSEAEAEQAKEGVRKAVEAAADVTAP